MKNGFTLVFVLLMSTGFFVSCSKEDHTKEQNSSSHEDGPHGGHLVELGSAGHLELIHSHEKGTVHAYITGPDPKQPLNLEKPPELKIITKDGQKVVAMKPKGALPAAEFEASDEAFKVEHLEGRIAITIGEKTFNPDLEETHHDD